MQAFLEYLFHHNGQITVVYPGGMNLEDYVFDLEGRFYNVYKEKLNAKYTDYRIYKKRQDVETSTDYVVDPLCYELELRQKDRMFDLISEYSVKGRLG